MAEPADFVHVYDAKNGYEKEQEIDFFGEISGVSFSPDTEALYIGVWDRTYGSLLEYGRCRNYSYLDSFVWVDCIYVCWYGFFFSLMQLRNTIKSYNVE